MYAKYETSWFHITIKYGLHFDQNDLEHILQVVARKKGIASIADRLLAWPGSRDALRSKTEAEEKVNQLEWAFPVLQAWLNGYSLESEKDKQYKI